MVGSASFEAMSDRSRPMAIYSGTEVVAGTCYLTMLQTMEFVVKRNTVLVVEDDTLLRFHAVTVFREAGLDVVETGNADDALAYAWEQSSTLAAVFTDWQLPGHSDGLHLAEVVSRHWPHIVVLITSGRIQPMEPLPSNVRFLPKPWLPLTVLTLVQDAIAA